MAKKHRPEQPPRIEKKLAMLRATDPATLPQPWLTVRDATSDLPDPEKRPTVELVQAHRFQPGAARLRLLHQQGGTDLHDDATGGVQGRHGAFLCGFCGGASSLPKGRGRKSLDTAGGMFA